MKSKEPIPLLDVWWRDDEENGRFMWAKHSEFMREMNEQVNEQSKMFKGKLKGFKNCPKSAKHVFFVT